MVGSGLSMGFWSLVLCRAAVGVGEASFVALASTFIGAPSALHAAALRRDQVTGIWVQHIRLA